MKKGGKSNIEKKLEGIHYPFSEDSWDKMEMLLNNEEDKLTGGLPAPQDGNTVQGIFRSIGILAVLTIATLGASSPSISNAVLNKDRTITNTEKLVITDEPKVSIDDKKLLQETTIERTNKTISQEVVTNNKKQLAVVPQIPHRKQLLVQNEGILLKRSIQISPLDNEIPTLVMEPNLGELVKHKPASIWHIDLQFGYERVPQSFLFFNDFKNRFHTGLNINKALNKNIALNFNYNFSMYYKELSNDLLLSMEDDSNELSSSDSTSTANAYDNNLLRSNFRNFSNQRVFSNSVGLSTILKVKKWSFETGIFYEQFIPQQGINGNNWGINTSINRRIFNRIDLNLTGRLASSKPSIETKLFNNYSLGIGLKYKLK